MIFIGFSLVWQLFPVMFEGPCSPLLLTIIFMYLWGWCSPKSSPSVDWGHHRLQHKPQRWLTFVVSDCWSIWWVRQVRLQSGVHRASRPSCLPCLPFLLLQLLACASKAFTFTFCPSLDHLQTLGHSAAFLVIVSVSLPKSKAVVSWQYHKDSNQIATLFFFNLY